jgi:hypothetical protein
MRVPTPLIVLAFVLALPALVPYAIGRHYLYLHRLRTAAKRSACPSCGRTLGIEALHDADEHWRAHLAELHRAYPGARLRVVRFVDAICVHCRASLRFREDSGTFTRTEAMA